MNDEQLEHYRDMINAYLDGKDVQWHSSMGDWHDVDSDTIWNGGYEYRIKPKPREWWICWGNDDNPDACRYPSPKYTEYCVNHFEHYVLVREVLE